MTESKNKIKFSYDFFVPLSREEWEKNLEANIERGLARPGQTYEQYRGELYVKSWHPYPPGPGDLD